VGLEIGALGLPVAENALVGVRCVRDLP